MNAGESLIWHADPSYALLEGVVPFLCGGLFLMLPAGMVPVMWWWPFLLLPASVVLGVVISAVNIRLWRVTHLEFSRDGVGVVTNRRERFVAATDLIKVVVQQNESAGDGSTSVRLVIAGQRDVAVRGVYDPEVAAVITRLFASAVTVVETPGDSALPE